jgi:hypothetical protein
MVTNTHLDSQYRKWPALVGPLADVVGRIGEHLDAVEHHVLALRQVQVAVRGDRHLHPDLEPRRPRDREHADAVRAAAELAHHDRAVGRLHRRLGHDP